MAFCFTLLYLVTIYLSPTAAFGPFAEYRAELILTSFTIILTLPSMAGSGVLASRQTVALGGLSFAVVASIVATGWIGGAAAALYGFLPVLSGFYLVSVNCRSKAHLQFVIFGMFLASLFIEWNGIRTVMAGESGPYVYGGPPLGRIRGLGWVNDPNDLAQVLVSLVPCLFLFWKRGHFLRNLFTVLIPATLLIVGMYFTHSRGGAIALMAVIIISARRNVGTIPAGIGGFALLALALALGWSGGRDVSVEGGRDRLELWYTGLQLLKSHPLFGVGVGRFTDFSSHTAHNSVIVCAAELGMVGLIFWVMFVFSTMRRGILLGQELKPTGEATNELGASQLTLAWESRARANPSTNKANQSVHPYAAKAMSSGATLTLPIAKIHSETGAAMPVLEDDEIRRMARLLVYALIGFLIAGWFLSRALSIWLFMYAGMLFSILRMAEAKGIAPGKDSFGSMLRWSVAIAIGLLCIVSVILRLTTE